MQKEVNISKDNAKRGKRMRAGSDFSHVSMAQGGGPEEGGLYSARSQEFAPSEFGPSKRLPGAQLPAPAAQLPAPAALSGGAGPSGHQHPGLVHRHRGGAATVPQVDARLQMTQQQAMNAAQRQAHQRHFQNIGRLASMQSAQVQVLTTPAVLPGPLLQAIVGKVCAMARHSCTAAAPGCEQQWRIRYPSGVCGALKPIMKVDLALMQLSGGAQDLLDSQMVGLYDQQALAQQLSAGLHFDGSAGGGFGALDAGGLPGLCLDFGQHAGAGLAPLGPMAGFQAQVWRQAVL